MLRTSPLVSAIEDVTMTTPAHRTPRRSLPPVTSDGASERRGRLSHALSQFCRPFFRAAVAAGIAGSLALGAASVAAPTHAGWSDAVNFKAVASAGSWSTQPPATPANSVIVNGNTTTSITAIKWDIDAAQGNLGFCASVTIKGTTASPARWELDADLDKPPFSGQPSLDGIYYQDKTQVKLSLAPGNPRIMVITGVGDPGQPWNSNYNNVMLDSSKTLTIKLCVSTAMVPGLGQPSWYTATTTRGDWTDTRACKVLTVTGKVQDLTANPFYFGWKANLDLTDAKARVAEHKTINDVSWSPWPSNGYQFYATPNSSAAVPDTFFITSGRMTVIKGTQRVTITACVTGH